MEIRPADLLKEWKSGKLRPAYFLAGEEGASKSQALEALRASFKDDAFNFSEHSGDAAGLGPAIVSEALTPPVFASRRIVIVSLAKAADDVREALRGYLEEPLETTTLVLVADDKKPDPKDSLRKLADARGGVCVFWPFKEEEAQALLVQEARKAGKSLDPAAAGALVAEAGVDWRILKQELEKLVLFAGPVRDLTLSHVLACLGYRKASDPFAMARFAQSRRLKEALAHLRRHFQDGKPSDQAFGALAQIRAAVLKQFRARRMLEAGAGESEVFGALRLNPRFDGSFLTWLKPLSERRLRLDLKRCLRTETDLKSKTWLDPKTEIEHLVVELCRKG